MSLVIQFQLNLIYQEQKGDYVQGKNSFTSGLLADDFSEIENHYVGPTPPDQDHQYELTVYALDHSLNLKNGST